MLFCRLKKSTFSKNSFRNTIRESNSLDTIRPNKMLGLIWIQSVCKGYQQKTLVGKELTHWWKIKILKFQNSKLKTCSVPTEYCGLTMTVVIRSVRWCKFHMSKLIQSHARCSLTAYCVKQYLVCKVIKRDTSNCLSDIIPCRQINCLTTCLLELITLAYNGNRSGLSWMFVPKVTQKDWGK